jgi:aspartate carbamoyltransferase catalytic subunit
LAGSSSSVVKGETLLDTARNLEAMAPDVLVIRHKESGAPQFLANRLKSTAVVNAGDGMHEHPTQALLDCLSLLEHFEEIGRGSIEGLRIAIVGDIRHSRVARSNIWAHKILGNEIRLVGPSTLLPREFAERGAFGGLPLYHDLRSGLEGADVVIALRMQLERMEDQFVPSLEEYSREFGINEHLLSEIAPDCVVLHPGPIKRGIELTSEVADGPRSLISRQVTNGVAVRMAVLFALALGVGMPGGPNADGTAADGQEVIK